MECRNQHYLPQFFLRGFAEKRNRGSHFCWVFTKDKAPFNTNTRNIAAQRYFYSKNDNTATSLDSQITQAEGLFSSDLVSILSTSDEQPIAPETAARFLVHIAMRAKHIRDTIEAAIHYMRAQAIEITSDDDKTDRFFGVGPDFISKNVKQIFIEELEKKTGRHFTEQERVIILKKFEPQIIQVYQNKKSSFTDRIEYFFDDLAENSDNLVSSIHKKSLAKFGNPPERTSYLGAFHWRKIYNNESDYILGDVGPCVYMDELSMYAPYIFGGSDFDQIFLPISSSQMLVGEKNRARQISPQTEFNKISATLSATFFVAEKNDSSIRSLSDEISINLHKFLESSVQNLD